MRIGINLYALTLHGGGMREYVVQLLPWLVRRSSHSFLLFYASQGQPSLALILRQLSRSERGRVETVEIIHQDEIYRHAARFDLFFCPLNGFAPDLTDRPTVGTLADVQERFFPEYFTAQQLASRAVVYPRMARAVTRLITISQFSLQSISRAFDVPAGKVRAIFLAPGESLRRAKPAWPSSLPRPADPFVLYPANLYPHKNHELLLQAIARLRARGLFCAAVCTGQPADPGIAIQERIAAHGLGDRVAWLGQVPTEALRYLYEQAAALCFPSQFEGFGLPLVEAMMCGCPVITSPAASIPEVAGDGAWIVPPTAEAFADAIERLLSDGALRADLVARGKARGQLFDIRALVDETLKVLEEAATAFDAAANPPIREPLSYLVHSSSGAALKPTLASLAMELHGRDEVLVFGKTDRLDPHGRALAANLPGLRFLPAGADPREALRQAAGQFVCLLEEGDRLCEGASGAVQAAWLELPDRVACLGEALAVDAAGDLCGIRWAPSTVDVRRAAAPVATAAVFWRRGFLAEHQEHLRTPLWPKVLLAGAADRVAILPRALAYVRRENSAKAAISEVASLLTHLVRPLPAAGVAPAMTRLGLIRGFAIRARRQVGRLARSLARRLPPRWKRALRRLDHRLRFGTPGTRA
jgi:glycosyltransferase involved in cell wall biosynthesis